MTLTAALLAHAVAFWGGVWLAASPTVGDSSWLLSYLAGVAFLVAGLWVPRVRLGTKAALQVIGYAALLAVLFWGANMALDLLGNSVRTGRLPPNLRMGLPLHLFLVPGVASVALASLVGSLVQRVAARRAAQGWQLTLPSLTGKDEEEHTDAGRRAPRQGNQK